MFSHSGKNDSNKNLVLFILTGKDFEAKYKTALQLLSSQQFSLQNYETEFAVVQNIHKLLAGRERYQDVRKFDELYNKLKISVMILLMFMGLYQIYSVIHVFSSNCSLS